MTTIEAKIRAAVEEAKRQGWKIEPGAYLKSPITCCPLGAFLINEPLGSPKSRMRRIADKLGVAPSWVDSFAAGFDLRFEHLSSMAYRLGRKFRREFVGGAK